MTEEKPAKLLSLEDAEKIARRVVTGSQEGEIMIQNTELKELGDTTVYEVEGFVKVLVTPEVKGLFGNIKQAAKYERKPFTIQILPTDGKVIGRKLG
jgi:hypothetical protein